MIGEIERMISLHKIDEKAEAATSITINPAIKTF
jgi:hypothetical protein